MEGSCLNLYIWISQIEFWQNIYEALIQFYLVEDTDFWINEISCYLMHDQMLYQDEYI